MNPFLHLTSEAVREKENKDAASLIRWEVPSLLESFSTNSGLNCKRRNRPLLRKGDSSDDRKIFLGLGIMILRSSGL
jgi:hypothetical protein